MQQLATYNGMQSTLIDPRIPMEFIEHARAFRMKSEATDNELNAATDHRQAGAKARKPKPIVLARVSISCLWQSCGSFGQRDGSKCRQLH